MRFFIGVCFAALVACGGSDDTTISVAGTVVDASGRLAPNVTVIVWPSGATSPSVPAVDDRGEFNLDHVQPPYAITVGETFPITYVELTSQAPILVAVNATDLGGVPSPDVVAVTLQQPNPAVGTTTYFAVETAHAQALGFGSGDATAHIQVADGGESALVDVIQVHEGSDPSGSPSVTSFDAFGETTTQLSTSGATVSLPSMTAIAAQVATVTVNRAGGTSVTTSIDTVWSPGTYGAYSIWRTTMASDTTPVTVTSALPLSLVVVDNQSDGSTTSVTKAITASDAAFTIAVDLPTPLSQTGPASGATGADESTVLAVAPVDGATYIFSWHVGVGGLAAGFYITPQPQVSLAELEKHGAQFDQGATVSWTATAKYNTSDGTRVLLNRGTASADGAITQTTASHAFTMASD